MIDPGTIRNFLKNQDPEQVERFIRHLSALIDDHDLSDVNIWDIPFPAGSEECKQLIKIKKAAKDLFLALLEYGDSNNYDRLAYYLKPPGANKIDSKASKIIIDGAIDNAMRVYSNTCYALRHGEITRTGGRPDGLDEVEKLKLRRLQGLFERYFPNLDSSFKTRESPIYQIGCNILGRNDSLGKYPDKSIKIKSLEI